MNKTRIRRLVFLLILAVFISSVSCKPNNEASMKINIKVNGNVLTATLSDNSSAKALYGLLEKGDLTIKAHDYGGFEKVGNLPESIPRNDEEITTSAGDIILYLGNSICFYYNTNSWNFTRLGRIDGAEKLDLRKIYGKGDAVFVLSLVKERTYEQISQKEAARIMAEESGFIILDVRTEAEFQSGHIPGAICIPNESIDRTPPSDLPDFNQTILVYCRSGNRSKQAARKLADMGYSRILEFGGINTWPGEIVTD